MANSTMGHSPTRGLCARALGAAVTASVLLGSGAAARAQHEEAVAPRLDALWRRHAVAVQPRAVPKDGALELVGLAGVIPNDAFVIHVPVGLRAAYHLTEQWGLELGFAYNLHVETGLRRYLEDNDAQLRARLRDRQQLRANAALGWSPVYGKLAVGEGILQLDGYVVAGAGIVRTLAEPAIELEAAVRPEALLGVGLRLFVGSRVVVRLEYRQYLYARPVDRQGQGGGVGYPAELAVGVGALLGGRR